MNKDFNLFMSQLQETNQTLDFFCDFDKISANVAEVEMSLNTLNYLIGKDDLQRGVEWARRERKRTHVFNYELMRHINGGKQMTDVWRLPLPPPARPAGSTRVHEPERARGSG